MQIKSYTPIIAKNCLFFIRKFETMCCTCKYKQYNTYIKVLMNTVHYLVYVYQIWGSKNVSMKLDAQKTSSRGRKMRT